MADVNREVSIAINIAGNASAKLPEIAALLSGLKEPINSIGKSLSTIGKGLTDFSAGLGSIKTNIPDLSGFSSSLTKLANNTGTDKLTKLSASLTSFKDIKLPANFDKFVIGIKGISNLKAPPDLTSFVKSLKVVAGVKNIPTAQLSKLSDALIKYKDVKGLPQNTLISFAKGLQELAKVKGIHSENLKNIAIALDKFTKIKVPTGDRISKFVDGLKRLTEVKGIRVTNLAAIGQALQSFGSITKIPKLDAFIDSLKRLAKLDFKNIGTATQQIKSFAQSIASLSNSLPAVTNSLTKNATAANKTSSSMNKLNTAVKKVDSTYGNFMKKIERYAQYRLIADSIIGLKEAFYTGFQEIVNYDQALKDLQAITSSTAGQVEMMGATIKQVASDTKFSASEVAVGMRTLGQAGFSAQESIGAMESIANLATGTLSSMDQAVDLVSTAIRVYGADTLDAAKASDVFANAVNKSKLTIDKIRTSFNYIGPIAKNAGITFEETASAMAVLANAGLKASKIGTGLRRVIAELVDPNKRLAEAVKLAGLSLDDLNPQKNNLDTVLRNLSIVLTDSSVAFDLFGKRGAAAALTLTQDASAFKDMQKVIGESGTAAEMAEIQMEGLGVSFKNLRDKLSLVMVALGEAGLIEGMKSFVDILRAMVDGITAFINSGVGKITVQMALMATKVMIAFVAFKALRAGMIALRSVELVAWFAKLSSAVYAYTASLLATATGNAAVAASSSVAATSITAMGAAARTAAVSFAAMWAAIWPVALVMIAVAAALIAVAVLWNKFKTAFVSGSQEVTKEAYKTSESVTGLLKSFEAYKKDIAGLEPSSEKYMARSKQMRAELAKVVNENGRMSGAALKAMGSINALTGEVVDGGTALREYAAEAKKVEFETMVEGIQSLSATFDEVSGVVNTFWGNFTGTGSEIVNMVDSFKKGEVSIESLRTRLEELNDTGDLPDWGKGILKSLNMIDMRTTSFIQKLAGKSLINVDMTVDELLRVDTVYNALIGSSDAVKDSLIKNFKEYAKAVKDQQEAIVEKWNETGTVMDAIAKDETGAYAELKKSVDSLIDAEKLRVMGIEATQASLASALAAERAEYDKKVKVLEAVAAAAKGGSEEQKQAVRDLAALDVQYDKTHTALLKKATELQKKKWGDPEYARLMKEQTAIFKYELAKQAAADETNLNSRRAMYAQASIDFEKAMKRAKIHVIDEDSLDKDLDALEAARDIALAENEVYLSKNEHNLAQSISNEFDIQDKFFTDSINAKQAYRDSLFELNENNPEIDKQDKEIRELKQEHYEALLDSAKDYYEELADLKGDFKDVEKDLAKESKLHLKNIQKQLKAEEKFKDKKQDLWDKYKDKRKDQLEKLKDLEESYREDKFQAEKDLRDKILGLEDSLEDKIRKKEQSGMSSKQKARDDEKTYNKKMQEANALLAKGIRESDEGIIERAEKKFQQSQDLAQSFKKQKKSINGMKKSNEGLIKSEKALADIQGKKRDEDYKDDKKEIKTDLATATKEYIKARDDMTASFKKAQDDIKQAIAEELGVRKDLYKTVEGFEDARHAKISGNLDAEKEKIVALIELYSKLAPSTEQKAAVAKPEADTGTGQKASDKVVAEYKQMGEAINRETKAIAEKGYRTIEEGGKKVYTNLTTAQVQANGLIAESMQQAGAAAGAMGEQVKGSYGQIFNAAGELITKIKDGVRIEIKPPENVPDLRKVVPEELEVEIRVDETMGRVGSYIDELQGKIKGIGETASGLKIITPKEEARIDAVAQKISGLFDGLSTDDPKQQLKDMLTVVAGIGPMTQEQARIARDALTEFAANIPDVNIESSIEIDKNGNWNEVIKIVNDLGIEYTNLNENIQSNPLEILPESLKESIINNVESIEGAMLHLKERVTEETAMKISAEKAQEEMTAALDSFYTVKDEVEKTPITPDFDLEEIKRKADEAKEYFDFDADEVKVPVDAQSFQDEVGDAAEAAAAHVESMEPVEIPFEMPVDEAIISLQEFGVSAETVINELGELDGKEITVPIKPEDKEIKETITALEEVTAEKQDINVDISITHLEDLKEIATILEKIDEAENTKAEIEVEVEPTGMKDLIILKESIEEVAGKFVEVVANVTGTPDILAAKRAIDKIPKETHKYVYIHTIDVKGKEGGGFIDTVSRFAGGGDVFRRLASPFIGTGSGRKDDVPAMLMKGEFVLKKSAVEKYGKKFLYAMNMGMLNFDSAVSKFAHGGPVQNVANNVSNMMTFPTHFEAGGFVNKAKNAAFMMGRQAQLGLNPKAPFQNDDVVYNINAPSFHQHLDTQVGKIKSTPGKARALNLMKLFSALAPKLKSGGNVSELMSQYHQEKSIITQQYTEDIRYAKESGDDEQAYLLEMEQLQLEELAATLAITLNEIRLDYEQEMLDATIDLEDQVAEFEEDKEDAALDYREAMSDLNSERADIEREYLKEKRELERDLTKAETELEVAQRNFDAGAYVKAGGKDYWQRRGSNRFTYNTVKSPAYNMLQDKVTTAKAEIVDVKQGLVNVESDFEVQKDHTEEDEKNIEFRQTTASDRADRRIVRTQNNFTASASGLENRYEQEAKGEAEHVKNEASMIKLETSHDVSVSKSETSHEVSKLGFELQLELLHLRQTYDELIREEKRRLEDEAKSEYSTSVAPQQNIGIKYWLNKGGYVGFPRGKKRWEDSVEAMLTPGEYVVTEDAVDHYGIDFMEALNNREVDPEYNAFPSFLAEPKIVNTPTTINGVTYHVNAPSFHDNLAMRSNKLVTSEGQASAKRMVSMFSDAVPHLATGGDIGNAEEQLAFELTNTQAEYDEKIRYAKAVGADDLAFILENEKIELAMIAEELRFTLMDLKDQRDFAIQEAELDRDQELLDNQMELEEDLFAIQEDRMDARIAMQDAVDDANDARKDAEMDLSYAQTAQSDYDSEYGGAGSRFPTKLNAKQKAALAKLDSFVYGATGKRLYASVASTESQAMTYFTAANQAITSRAPSTTGSSSPFGTGFGGTGSINRSTRSSTAIPVETQMQHRTTISEIKEEFTNAKPSEEDIPDAPPESDIDRPKEEIKRARLQAARARQRYATLMGMYAKQETKERYEKSAQDTIDLKTYDYAVTKADRTFTHGSKKALNVAANDTRKVKNDSAHDYTQREEEMINEIQLLEIELAKALFDLKKEYSTADGSVSVKHWLNTGGSVGHPVGATRGIDSVSAMLTPGEYVVNEGAVRKFGVEFFEKLNKMKLPSLHFADGGLVPGSGLLSGSATESLTDKFLGTVNLQVGKKQFPVKTNLSLAKDLVKEFKKMGLSIA